MSKQDEIYRKLAIERMAEWFDTTANRLEDGAKSIRRYKADFLKATEADKGTSPVDILSWAVNEINNISSNFRLDIPVHYAPELIRKSDT